MDDDILIPRRWHGRQMARHLPHAPASSWWVGKDRAAFAAAVEAELPRMKESERGRYLKVPVVDDPWALHE